MTLHRCCLLASVLVLTLASGLGLKAASARKPNILFIAVDDLRAEFGAYGSAIVKSPHLDRLARSGITFDRAYCQQAVCSPSRTVVMTGARPDTTKVWDLETHFRTAMPTVVTLGQHFRQHGYFVQGMGKIYHGGFDDAPTWSTPWQTPRAPAYARPENLELARKGAEASGKQGAKKKGKSTPPNSRGPAFESADVPDETYTDGKTAALAVATLQQLAVRGEPFFLAVGFSKPHLPFVAPKRYWDLYDPEKIPLARTSARPTGAPDFAILPGGEMRAYHGIPAGTLPEPLARQLKHGYYASISYMDAQLGRVLDELDRLGLRENTVIVLWGDHGWKLGEHDAWCKHSNCEHDTRAPLIVAAPAVKEPGRRSPALVEFVDIYPTLCDLAGLPLPSHLEGLSFKPLLAQPDRTWKRAAFSQYPRNAANAGGALMGYSMRTAQHRFTVWVTRDDVQTVKATELYDLAGDPEETLNLASLPEHAGLVERLMVQWRGGWKAALPDAFTPSTP